MVAIEGLVDIGYSMDVGHVYTQCKTAHVQEKTAPTSWCTEGFINADTKLKSRMQLSLLLHGRQQNWQQSFLHVRQSLVEQFCCLGREGGGRPGTCISRSQTHVYILGELQLNPWL